MTALTGFKPDHSKGIMRRDMELIRELLLRFENNDQSVPPSRTKEEVAYHVNQMQLSGLVDAVVAKGSYRGTIYYDTFFIKDITPAGHDLLDAMRNDTFWNKLKAKFEEAAAPMAFDLIVEASKQLAKQALSL